MNLKQSSAHWSTNEIALELCNLGCDLVHAGLALLADLLVLLTNLLLLLLTHALLHFLSLGEPICADAERDIPLGKPLVACKCKLRVFLLKHFSSAIVHNKLSVVTSERVQNTALLRLTEQLVDNIV